MAKKYLVNRFGVPHLKGIQINSASTKVWGQICGGQDFRGSKRFEGQNVRKMLRTQFCEDHNLTLPLLISNKTLCKNFVFKGICKGNIRGNH